MTDDILSSMPNSESPKSKEKNVEISTLGAINSQANFAQPPKNIDLFQPQDFSVTQPNKSADEAFSFVPGENSATKPLTVPGAAMSTSAPNSAEIASQLKDTTAIVVEPLLENSAVSFAAPLVENVTPKVVPEAVSEPAGIIISNSEQDVEAETEEEETILEVGIIDLQNPLPESARTLDATETSTLDDAAPFLSASSQSPNLPLSLPSFLKRFTVVENSEEFSSESQATANSFPNKVIFDGSQDSLASLPKGSFLQILNLPLDYNTESKFELASIFSQYGDIYGISFSPQQRTIHGFIYFGTPEAMSKALKSEDRREMPQGFKLDLVDGQKRLEYKARRLGETQPKKQPVNQKKAEKKKRERSGSRSRSRDRRPKKGDNNSDSSFLRSTPALEGAIFNTFESQKPPVDVQIIALGNVSDSFVEHVERRCSQASLKWRTKFLKYNEDIGKAVIEFQRTGVSGLIFVERKGENSRDIALQLFPVNSASKEFPSISVSEACAIINNERRNFPIISPPTTYGNGIPTISPGGIPPQQLAALLAFAQANPSLDPNVLISTLGMAQPNSISGQHGLLSSNPIIPVYAEPQYFPQQQQQHLGQNQHHQQQLQTQITSKSSGISGLLSQLTQNQNLLNMFKK